MSFRRCWQQCALLACVVTGTAWAVGPCGTLPAATTPGFQATLQTFLDNKCYATEGWQHDPNIRGTNGVHPNVKVWYSPNMWSWMTGGRQGDAPEGGVLVKEQYGETANPRLLTDWSVMVRDKGGAWDGWWWGDLSAPSAEQTPLPPSLSSGPNCAQAQYPYAGFGEYCINCHASATNGQDTFATTRFVLGTTGPELTHFPPDDNLHYHLAHRAPSGMGGANDKACLVPESSDHVVASAKPEGAKTFLTSDQCTGCHNATGTLSPARPDLPSMLHYLNGSSPAHDPKSVNLSPNGEWRFSMMGLAGRDPIFFSQLNSETTLHANLKLGGVPAKPFVQNLCLHCHGVMGQRQYAEDTGKLFTLAEMKSATSPYGALARDGISCTVCHRIAADGLGTAATFTGNFKVGPANHMYGPFDDPLKLPMKNALNMQPETAPQITGSALCGSCHTIILPVFRANGNPVMEGSKGQYQQRTFIEQATFYEWLNSKFADNGSDPQSCQQCHMPDTYMHEGKESPALQYKIANIEDNTFPAVDHRAPNSEITMQKRSGYRRHLLLGINLFALEMFKQFRTELGLYTPDPANGIVNPDPMIRQSLNTADGLETAIDQGSNFIAKARTAEVKILSVQRRANAWQVDVQVTNEAGHSFPSGVGFRRAFLNFEMLAGDGQVVWASGQVAAQGERTPYDLKGVIVDGWGRPLQTETFTPWQQRFQPHYWEKNPITRQDQVQIYEELVTNPEGFLTTSFLALNQKAKDNRLQPQGWTVDGPQAEETAPVGTCVEERVGVGRRQEACDPHYTDGSGASVVRYLVPLGNRTLLTERVRATLYYQTIPPYYQLQRATEARGVDTERLVRFVKNLQVQGTEVENWVLRIAGDEVGVE